MTDSLEARYRRLLRWYPSSWRTANAEIVLGTLLDSADADVRNRPAPREALSIALHGSAARLDARAGLIFAMVASAASAAAGVLLLFSPQIGQAGLAWLPPTLLLLVTPSLLSIAGAGWLGEIGLFGPVRVVTVPTLTVAASIAALATALSWSAGFAAADDDLPRSQLGLALNLAWFIIAWSLGAAVIAAMMEAVLRRTRLPRFARWSASAATGVLLAPALGYSLMSPTVGVVTGVALILLLGFRVNRSTPPARPLTTAMGAPTRLVAALAWTSTGLGAVSIAFALTGSLWFAALDATQAMQLGLAGALLAAIPLIAAVALIAPRRLVSRPGIAATLLALALAIASIASFLGFATGSSEVAWTGMVVAMLVAGAAVGVIVHGLLRGSHAMRVFLAILIGAGFGVTLAIALVFTLAFTAPVLGAVLGVRALTSAVRRPVSATASH